MQYTVRNVPKELDRALRERAEREERSLNQVVVAALAEALGVDPALTNRDLSDIAGSWVEDSVAEAAFADQRAIDEDLWP